MMEHIKIRLYNPFDLDLIALYDADNFSIRTAMREAVDYYAKGKRVRFEIPPLPFDTPTPSSDKETGYAVAFNIDFDRETYPEALAMISAIPAGYRNAFIKNLFRSCLEVNPGSYYFGSVEGAEHIANLQKQNPIKLKVQNRTIFTKDNPFLTMGENEVGMTIKESTGELPSSFIPAPVHVSEVKTQKTAEDPLRSATRNAYSAGEENKAELEDLLSQMMENND